MQKTLAMKFLEGKKITYLGVEYPAELKDASQIAQYLGIPAELLFKTLVVPASSRPGTKTKPMLVMIPAGKQLDLKKLAKAVGQKKLRMATHSEAERITGLQVGGISALALLNRGFVVYLDSSAEDVVQIYVSAGQKGLNLRVAVDALVKVTGARMASLCRVEDKLERY